MSSIAYSPKKKGRETYLMLLKLYYPVSWAGTKVAVSGKYSSPLQRENLLKCLIKNYTMFCGFGQGWEIGQKVRRPLYRWSAGLDFLAHCPGFCSGQYLGTMVASLHLAFKAAVEAG
jgi:hypothetical protein